LIGKTLAHYEITGKLGAGGMGEVYRARDAKLGREVAVKILPAEFADDPERLARFRREAKVLASLNHPNIAALYGLEQADRTTFLVMEVAEGKDLEELIGRGPLPLDEALRIADGIASGLEEAHDKGVVHRDLKPANVVVGDGKVKVLDFGLASAYAGDRDGEENILNSPTITQAFTQPGMILGTAAYMSPEQARGKKLDKRTDIWSFGVILYEMLTGDRVFHGETVTDTLTGILHRTPDLEKIPASTPASVRRILARCLAKDSARRLRDIGEVRIALLPESIAELEAAAPAQTATPPAKGGQALAWIVAAIALAGAAFMSWLIFSQSEPPARELRASIQPPEGSRFEALGSHSGGLSLSPDGSRLTFTAKTEDSEAQLYLRSLDSITAQPIPGTVGATFPFWSADGSQIAFFLGGKLKKISLGGGAPITVCDASDGRGGTWNQDDIILFTPVTEAPIFRVSAQGGTATAITTLDPTRGNETTHRFPSFLPDGRHFLYVRGSHSAASGNPVNSIWIASLDSDETHELMQSGSNAKYALGHIFWVHDGFLMARPFDPSGLAFTGDGFPVGEEIIFERNYWRAAFAVSASGLVAFQHGLALDKVLHWFDREGNKLDELGGLGRYDHIRLSPDNQRLAVSLADPGSGRSDVWIYDVRRSVASRLTFDDSNDKTPIWSPDGSRIVYQSNPKGPSDIYVRPSNGRGEPQVLFESEKTDEPWDWSADGRFISFNHNVKRNDIWIMDVESGESSEFIASDYDDGWGMFSSDVNWLAYLSNESGRYDLYLTRFPSGDGKWQLSTEGADWLLGWNQNDSELYYLDLTGALTVVKISLDEMVEVELPQRLFATQSGNTWTNANDGERFVLGVPEDLNAAYPITLVVDWQGKR